VNKIKDNYIIADHIRSSCFIISDGIKPSGKQQGYILRRLIRRSLAASLRLNIDISNKNYFIDLVEAVCGIYDGHYPALDQTKDLAIELIYKEAQKYQKALDRGHKEWKKILQKMDLSLDLGVELANISWDLYQTHGIPIEASEDILAKEKLTIDLAKLNQLIQNHQKLSQESSKDQFKSGLNKDTDKTRRLHTVTHILHQILINTLGKEVKQMGSAITEDKARFDFSSQRKLTPEEVLVVEKKVQEIINKSLSMTRQEMPQQQARDLGAIGLFGEKYSQMVSVYTLEDKSSGQIYSREFCSGPHIQNSLEIGTFKIKKQKSIGQGLVRLVYDVEQSDAM
jgi:alanyl-tRNA synthetase